ncbi:unnamed protein product [Acidithrix sp. C25]|nr:unnamed protein product [Acidithrix sp. C25]
MPLPIVNKTLGPGTTINTIATAPKETNCETEITRPPFYNRGHKAVKTDAKAH